MTNNEILNIILKLSPKLQSLLSVVAEHVVLRDEKMIVWFSYPMTQELIQEIFRNDKFLGQITKSLKQRTTGKQRDLIRGK